jgi:signal transduction histidine kinase
VDYYLPEHRSVVENAMVKLIEDDIPLDFEAKLKTANGNIKWCRAIGRAVRKDGVCIKVYGTFQDVTEIKKAKKKIEELAKFPEENPDPVLRITKEGIIIYGNKASTVILQTWGKKIGESLPEVYLKRARKVLLSGEILIDEFECDNGRIFELIFTPIQEHGYVNIYGQDITQRKYIEDSLLKYHEQLKSLASKLTITEERERYRIATELHDHICQSLAISKIKLETVMSSGIATDACDTLSEVRDWITQVINDTRTLTFDLSSPILHELGFEKAVAAWLEDEIQLKHNIQTEFYCDNLSKPLDDDVRSLLFRDVRELLINIVKHAHAKTVKVSINRDANRIRVVVEDDGIGFDPVQVTAVAMSRAEFGLFSIRQRLEFLDGQFEIKSSPGKGCKITMLAPLKNVTDNSS